MKFSRALFSSSSVRFHNELFSFWLPKADLKLWKFFLIKIYFLWKLHLEEFLICSRVNIFFKDLVLNLMNAIRQKWLKEFFIANLMGCVLWNRFIQFWHFKEDFFNFKIYFYLINSDCMCKLIIFIKFQF